jgi:cytidylate kinase
VKTSYKRKLTIAIDGPSGAGKSTVAKALAKRLGYRYIDTGAMYRAVAVKTKKEHIEIEDEEALRHWVQSLHIQFITENGENLVFCDGEDVTQAIRWPEVGLLASDLSKRKGVREALVQFQREMGKGGGVVLEGRDTGTVVFPKADVKFYLDADAGERAKRRHRELLERGEDIDFKAILEEVLRRDHNDMNRTLSPLRKAEDAVLIDSTHWSAGEVVDKMVRMVKSRASGLRK